MSATRRAPEASMTLRPSQHAHWIAAALPIAGCLAWFVLAPPVRSAGQLGLGLLLVLGSSALWARRCGPTGPLHFDLFERCLLGEAVLGLLLVQLAGVQALPWLGGLGALLCLLAWRRDHRFVLLGWLQVGVLPWLGRQTLWDPWETHYGEVAREVLARGDWISLWWAQDGWFWSKPVLIFWSEALARLALGVPYKAGVFPAGAEWAARLPVALLGLGVALATYGVGRSYGRPRAGLCAALVAWTAALPAILSQHAITDFYFAGLLALALLAMAVALHPRSAAQANPKASLLLGMAVLAPQLAFFAYALARNLGAEGLVRDAFYSGSPGNTALLGNAARELQQAALGPLAGQPGWLGLIGLPATLLLTRHWLRQGTVRSLALLAFYAACGFAVLAKGLAGVALPGLIMLLFLVAEQRWQLLHRGGLQVAAGAGTVTLIAAPWYLAMTQRHGTDFLMRLLVHDHFKRLATGVHGDQGHAGYYLEQLGFAFFPWVLLVPVLWLSRLHRRSAEEGTLLRLFQLATLSSFALFALMATKFHHYLLPALLPLAWLVGWQLGERWTPSERSARSGEVLRLGLGSALLAMALGLGYGDPFFPAAPAKVPDALASLWALRAQVPQPAMLLAWLGGALLIAPRSGRGIGAWALLGVALVPGWWLPVASVLALWTAPLAAPLLKGYRLHVDPARWLGTVVILGVGLLILLALVERNGHAPEGAARFAQLFSYQYDRPLAPGFNLTPRLALLTGLGIAACLLVWLRPQHTGLGLALAALLSLGLNQGVLAYDAPHYGQRELVSRYFAQRRSPDTPLVAFQMYWLGENFYSNNHVHAEKSFERAPVQRLIEGYRGQEAFFLVQHDRMERLRRWLDARSFEALTTPRDNRLVALVRAQL